MRSAIIRCAVAVAALTIVGCSTSGSLPFSASPGPTAQSGSGTSPFIVQNKRLGNNWIQIGQNTVCAYPGCAGIAVGSDGNLWATDPAGESVYQVTMASGIAAFATPRSFFPSHLATGTDGDLYITGNSSKYVVRMTTSGAIAQLPIPSHDRTFNDGIVGGSSAVWFLEGGHVGKITPDGTILEFAYPSGTTANNGAGITIGPDHRVWFVDEQAQTLGVVDQTTDTIVELAAGSMASCAPYDIVSAAGFLWVGCGSAAPELAKVTTKAKITYYAIALPVGQTPQSMAVGPNRDPWMVTSSPLATALSDFDPKTNAMTTYLPPARLFVGSALALAPDGNLWMAGDGEMDVFLHNVLIVRPTKVVLIGTGSTTTLAVKEPGTTSWTATSSDSSVATATQGSTNSQFVVTAVASGSCTVTVADAIGNSVVVSVVVQ